MSGPSRRTLRLGRPLDLRATLGPVLLAGDPTWRRLSDGSLALATRTPDGPGVEILSVDRGARTLAQEAFGPGREWLAERLWDLVGENDDDSGFEPPAQLLDVSDRYRGWRVPRTRRVWDALVPAVLGQKVTGKEAGDAYRRLLRRYGEAADCGPVPLALTPPPAVWASIPSWVWHTSGVGPERSRTVVRAARQAAALERLADRSGPAARQAMQSLPGVGEWTAAEVAQRALGDADALSVGDFHAAKDICFALEGVRDADDARLVELLEPYRPHRFRVQRLVELGRRGQPRRGPRYAGRDFRQV